MSFIDTEFVDKCWIEFVKYGGIHKILEPTQVYITEKLLDPSINKLKGYILAVIIIQLLILLMSMIIMYISVSNNIALFK